MFDILINSDVFVPVLCLFAVTGLFAVFVVFLLAYIETNDNKVTEAFERLLK